MTTHTAVDAHHHPNMDAVDVFGFWLYILTDCLLFATLFATFAVLHNSTFGGPTIKDITSLPYVFGETLFLLASSFTYGLAVLGMYQKNKQKIINWLVMTFILGAGLSSFFALVATHGLHVSIGLLSMAVVIFQVYKNGVTSTMVKRLTYLGLFWHFLDIVWIFVFTIVYLMGAI
jgi:cytochrome o ubiquinol oxidase subunit 3